MKRPPEHNPVAQRDLDLAARALRLVGLTPASPTLAVPHGDAVGLVAAALHQDRISSRAPDLEEQMRVLRREVQESGGSEAVLTLLQEVEALGVKTLRTRDALRGVNRAHARALRRLRRQRSDRDRLVSLLVAVGYDPRQLRDYLRHAEGEGDPPRRMYDAVLN